LTLVQNTLGTAARQSVLDLVEALIASDAAGGLECIHTTLDAGSDPRQFARQVVDYLRDLLVVRMGDPAQIEATPEIRQLMVRQTQSFTPADLLRILRLFNSAAVDARGAWQPSLPLEMAFIEALESYSSAAGAAPLPEISVPKPTPRTQIK
jgi:DNA polymerase-3 subunit gamma/tau